MTINLALDFSRDNAGEAKRALTRFMDQVNQDHQQNPKVVFSDEHKRRLGKIVENFNAKVLDCTSFKHSLEKIYTDVKGGH